MRSTLSKVGIKITTGRAVETERKHKGTSEVPINLEPSCRGCKRHENSVSCILTIYVLFCMCVIF